MSGGAELVTAPKPVVTEPDTSNQPVDNSNQPVTATAKPEPDTSSQPVDNSNQPVTEPAPEPVPSTTSSQPVVTAPKPDTSNPVTAPVVNKTDAKPDDTSNQPVTPPVVTDQCLKNASILSTVPSSCINPNAVPQLKKLVEAAIYQPVAAAGGELVSNALELTGNAALVEAALATALTPEQAAMLKTMSNDPKVAQTLAEIRDKLSVAVAQSIETAKETVAPQVEEAAGQVVNGVVVSIMNAVSDIPGVGFLLSALGAVDTGVKALEKAGDIKEELEEAAKPITNAIQNVSELANTLNQSAKQSVDANQSVNASQQEEEEAEAQPQISYGAETEMKPMGASAATASVNANQSVDAKQSAKKENTLPAPQFVEAKPQKPDDPNQPFARKQTPEEEAKDNAGLGGGGSRKRRRIRKLSRRIARTLRRVQKKYSLGLKAKDSFLRRTLNAKKLK